MEDLTQQGVYLDHAREEFADFVSRDALRVVDVGCGKGGFGRTLRDNLPDQAWVGGIEPVPDQAEGARIGHGFDEVLRGYFSSGMPSEWTNLDLMCFMDVLEHMYDPWLALYHCHDYLADDGRVLAAIPNIQYLPVLTELLRGKWQYEDTGTLDRTHVRFFTRRSVIEMFARAGFEVERIEGVSNVLDHFRFRHLRPLGSVLGDLRYLHMVVVARRVERPQLPTSILAPARMPESDKQRVTDLAESASEEQRRRDSPWRRFKRTSRHHVALEAKFRLGVPTELACDYHAWRRRLGRHTGPPLSASLGRRSSLAVVMHVFYPELLADLAGHLGVIDVPFDLLITNASGVRLDVPQTKAAKVEQFEVENHGRDVWPFMRLVQSGALDGYEAIIKLHTKRTPEHAAGALGAGSGDEWRENLVGSILGSVVTFHSALDAVTNRAGGLACHEDSIAGPEAWGHDRRAVRHLARRIGLNCRPSKLRFPAGSIFIMRGSLVEDLKGLRLNRVDFEAEDSHAYTTTAHALERLIGYVCSCAGYEIVGLELPRVER